MMFSCIRTYDDLVVICTDYTGISTYLLDIISLLLYTVFDIQYLVISSICH